MKTTLRVKQMLGRRAALFLSLMLATTFGALQPRESAVGASATDSQAAASSAALRAHGAIEMPAAGSTTTRLNTPCPDAKPGCYAIVTAGHGSATTLGTRAASLTGSGTYWVDYKQYNPFGVWQYTEKLTASDWYNGSQAGQYWVSLSHNLGAFYSEPSSQQGGFWDGGAWAWTNWGNDTEYYSFAAYNYTTFTYLRIYVQPNGHFWWWSGH